MIGAAEIRAMKQGAYPDQQQPRHRGRSRRARRGAAQRASRAAPRSTYFPVEPSSNARALPLARCRACENVILTPHIGGSTEEAQERIGAEVARKLVDYCDTGSTMGAVNFPQVQLPPAPPGIRYMHVHRNVPGMLRPAQRSLLAAGPQHRRAVSADGWRARLRRDRRRCARRGQRRAVAGIARVGGNDPRETALRAAVRRTPDETAQRACLWGACLVALRLQAGPVSRAASAAPRLPARPPGRC